MQLVLIAVLVFLNAALAGTEIALVSLREGQIRRMSQGSKTQRMVARTASDPNRFLATIQIGITLSGFLASATAAVALAEPLLPHLDFLGDLAEPAAVISVTLALTYLTLVLGELAPKRIALQRAEGWTVFVARPLNALASLSTPFVWLLGHSTDVVVRLAGGDPSLQREEVSEEELREMVNSNLNFERFQRHILSSAFEIQERRLKEACVPRPKVFTLHADTDTREAIQKMLECGHSRAPVTGSDIDDILGIAHLRDLINQEGPVRVHLREALFLPESMPVLDGLRQMQTRRQQLAIVIDEHGGLEGIVSVEDLLEELVGEIYDEFDSDTSGIEKNPDGSFDIPGALAIHDARDVGIILPEGSYTTVAGLLLERLGRLPDQGETTEVGSWRLTATKVGKRAIEEVKASPLATGSEEADLDL